MRAVLFQNDRVTETLIRHGADTAIRNGDGKTALDIAEDHGFAAMAAILRRASN